MHLLTVKQSQCFVQHVIMKSASLVHVDLFVMHFWQGLNKNGSLLIQKKWTVAVSDKTKYPQMPSESRR